MEFKEFTIPVPIALQELINTSNELLFNYKKDLEQKIEKSNKQMMQILNLHPDAGWELDMDRMVYVRPDIDIMENESDT